MKSIQTDSGVSFLYKSFTVKMILAISIILLVFTLLSCNASGKAEHQSMIHDMGTHVMPFNLNKTLHIFKMNETGGFQQVIVRDAKDDDQLPLIRQHLQDEAMSFAQGDFGDPLSIHGNDMPGIKDLETGYPMVKITYVELPNGGQITFETQDIRLITAIHSWFGAQLSDHGADATYR